MSTENEVRYFCTQSKQIEKPFNPELQARLILEEALETITALGFHTEVNLSGEWKLRKRTLPDGSESPVDLVETLDGVCDVIYVCYHLYVMYTQNRKVVITLDDFIREVCNNNNLKVIEPVFDENGKLKKPEGHPKPRIKSMIELFLTPLKEHPDPDATFVCNLDGAQPIYIVNDIFVDVDNNTVGNKYFDIQYMFNDFGMPFS